MQRSCLTPIHALCHPAACSWQKASSLSSSSLSSSSSSLSSSPCQGWQNLSWQWMEKPWEYLRNRTIAILGVGTPQGPLAGHRHNGRFSSFSVFKSSLSSTTLTKILVWLNHYHPHNHENMARNCHCDLAELLQKSNMCFFNQFWPLKIFQYNFHPHHRCHANAWLHYDIFRGGSIWTVNPKLHDSKLQSLHCLAFFFIRTQSRFKL